MNKRSDSSPVQNEKSVIDVIRLISKVFKNMCQCTNVKCWGYACTNLVNTLLRLVSVLSATFQLGCTLVDTFDTSLNDKGKRHLTVPLIHWSIEDGRVWEYVLTFLAVLISWQHLIGAKCVQLIIHSVLVTINLTICSIHFFFNPLVISPWRLL